MKLEFLGAMVALFTITAYAPTLADPQVTCNLKYTLTASRVPAQEVLVLPDPDRKAHFFFAVGGYMGSPDNNQQDVIMMVWRNSTDSVYVHPGQDHQVQVVEGDGLTLQLIPNPGYNSTVIGCYGVVICDSDGGECKVK